MRLFTTVLVLVAIYIIAAMTSSCSMKTFAPTALGAVGGGVGAIGGPGTAFAGAGLGAAAGQIIKESDTVQSQAEKLKALSEGDVSKLVELKLKEERGWFEKMINGVYDILMIAALAMVLYVVFNFWHGRKLVQNIKKSTNSFFDT
jgi:hypothetical protein